MEEISIKYVLVNTGNSKDDDSFSIYRNTTIQMQFSTIHFLFLTEPFFYVVWNQRPL